MQSFQLSDREAAQAERLAEQVVGHFEREKKAEPKLGRIPKELQNNAPRRLRL